MDPSATDIRFKKPSYPIGEGLARYLQHHGRGSALPIAYGDLLRHDGLMARRDAEGRETLWTAVMLRPSDIEETHERLVDLYQLLIADGRRLPHLAVAGIDFCAYGNSQPFRIKIQNQINDNHDYYYIKKADASRVYGLELEHLLSPNKINYTVEGGTLVEEHIIGVPGDDFMKDPAHYGGNFNPVRLCKEFVKFNERCFARLLGDMRAYNFVVDVIQDFDQVQYRIRSIDFDQQSYEGRKNLYLPQFFKENQPVVQMCSSCLNYPTMKQYQEEERTLIARRYLSEQQRVLALFNCMKNNPAEPAEKVNNLKEELGEYHHSTAFSSCTSMGEVAEKHLQHSLARHLI